MNYNNILIDTDHYKTSHFAQYPPGTEYVSSYIEARKNPWSKVTFYGLQHILAKLAKPITLKQVEQADKYWTSQGMPFNKDGWTSLVKKHKGKLPLKIQAVPEGTRLEHGNVLVQVVNTDPEFYWLTSWVETAMLRVWYPTTVASLSGTIRDMIKEKLEQTADEPEIELPFKLHDFGARGVSSTESAAIGGSAHLVNFMGSDTGVALMHAMEHYGAKMDATAFSIPAMEHSSTTSWGREHEADAFKNMLDKFGDGMLLAAVSDSYDIWNAVDNIWGKTLKDQVEQMDAMLVVRPDSGDPTTVPVDVVKRLDKAFGSMVNSKGYKVLNHVRVIQGDGINYDSIKTILDNLIAAGYSVSNVAFGMGGALLQASDRDTLGFAMKCSSCRVDGEWRDVYKDPITDQGKKSKKGRLALIDKDGELTTVREDELTGDMKYPGVNKLETVFQDGRILSKPKWDDVVARARS